MIKDTKSPQNMKESGQALVEYALILTLLILGLAAALAATGPVVGNVFSNAVTNLIGSNSELVAELPDSDEFWATVTWVATQTPAEVPLPTRTLPPPSATPTFGPSPTPTPITPTATFTPTWTPEPTATQSDIIHELGFTDSADDGTINWRLDDPFYTGSGSWHATFYPNRTLSPTGNDYKEVYNEIDFDWGRGIPVSGYPQDNFSATFRRQFFFSSKTTINVDLGRADDGVRVWILGNAFGGNPNVNTGGPGTCADNVSQTNGVRSGGDMSNSNPRVSYPDSSFGYNPDTDPDSAIPTGCLIIDDWRSGWSSHRNVRRTVPAGLYTIQVDYGEINSDARIRLNIGNTASQINPNDVLIDTSGNPIAGSTAPCDIGETATEGSNSLGNTWTESQSGTLPTGYRCHMELRGAVNIPSDAVDPTLTFWDIWDLRNNGAKTWVEVADYDPDDDGIFDRADLVWQRFDMHSGNIYNYNWTQQTIDLSSFIGRQVTFRFGMESASNNQTKWIFDTIEVNTDSRPDIYVAKDWDLNDPEQINDFITSGEWDLTSQKIVGSSGMSFHESPGYEYARFPWTRNTSKNSYNDDDMRMHTIEFKGFIDLNNSNGIADTDGDTGKALLTFFHQYDLDRRTGLEIQYTTDPYGFGEANWQEVPDGILIPRNQTNRPSINLFEEVVIDLEAINQSRFRLRFAMIVHPRADRDPGWWIDEIRLEREGTPRYLRFPYTDDVENEVQFDQDWLTLGSWGRVEGGFNPAVGTTGTAYHDSPDGNYGNNLNNVLQTNDPFDMFNDTEDNAFSAACNLGVACETTPDAAPVDPIMTFMHKRNLGSGENFWLEWKRESEGDNQWRYLWSYRDRMQTISTGNRTATRNSTAWERAEVDLIPLMNILTSNDDTGDDSDDDILIRFRFQTNNSSTNDGVWIDDIKLQEREERIFALWDVGTTRNSVDTGTPLTNLDGSNTLGQGLLYYDGLDNNPELFSGDWHFAGNWEAITWEQRGGLFAFHDSAEGQTESPPDPSTPVVIVPYNSFNVLEMATIIDLRGVDISQRPMLEFWERHHIGRSDRFSLQIAYQDDSFIASTPCRNNYLQCYEKLYGWSEWRTVWEENDREYNFTWKRRMISLDPYAAQAGRDGYRIRIRFVSDALDSNWDHGYVDDITFRHFEYQLNRKKIDKTISGGSFFDNARNMRNWIGEGSWGLSPEFFRGAGGGPANLGASVWNYKYFDMRPCPVSSTNDTRTCASQLFDSGAHETVTPLSQGLVLEINNNPGSGNVVGNERDYVAGRWTLQTGEVGPGVPAGTYTFITTSDDGVRLKYDTYPTPGGLPAPVAADDPAQSGWNIINNWTYHGRTVDMGIAKLANGNRYQFTLEWFEGNGGAVIILSTGSNNFSFTDSPKQGSGLAFNDVPPVARGNSALIYDGVFDLSTAEEPILEFYTHYEINGAGLVEVSPDGGFSWTRNFLDGARPRDEWDNAWTANFYNVRDLDFTGDPVVDTLTLDQSNNLWFDWRNNSPTPLVNRDNWSARWTRTITLTETTEYYFYINHDDGVRLWIDYANGCINETGSPIISGQGNTGNNQRYDTGCLILDNWRTGSRNTGGETRTLAPGTYTFQVDHFDATGNARLQFTMRRTGFNSTWISGDWMPDQGTWRRRIYDLTNYANAPQYNSVGLRFRLDYQNQRPFSEGNDFQRRNQSPVNWFEGWWIVDILVTDP